MKPRQEAPTATGSRQQQNPFPLGRVDVVPFDGMSYEAVGQLASSRLAGFLPQAEDKALHS